MIQHIYDIEATRHRFLYFTIANKSYFQNFTEYL